ncbi:hypothetical protein EAO75_34080 [Streptomyces sp. uw30]|nr:hypothetical protein EAO75_34080 [Streptomyces sp. uw30]
MPRFHGPSIAVRRIGDAQCLTRGRAGTEVSLQAVVDFIGGDACGTLRTLLNRLPDSVAGETCAPRTALPVVFTTRWATAFTFPGAA